jgi:hypothetical protein
VARGYYGGRREHSLPLGEQDLEAARRLYQTGLGLRLALERSLDLSGSPVWFLERSFSFGDLRLLDNGRVLLAGDERHELEQTDIDFENREDPQLHRFRSVEGGRGVVIWQRRRGRTPPD